MTTHTTTPVEARLTQAYRDMAAGDIERLMELYMQDALIQSPGEGPIAGAPAIRAFWQSTFDRYRVRLIPEVQEVTTFGEIVVVRGLAAGVLEPRSGEVAVPIDSWFMQIYRRSADGTLRFWRGTNGPNPATPSGKAAR